MQQESLVLLSGGIDSLAMAHFLVSHERKIQPLFVDYGQPAALCERKSCRAISEHFNWQLREIIVSGLLIPQSGEIRARNIFLISLAAVASGNIANEIGIGIHSGLPYYDCTDKFLNECKQVIGGLSKPTVSLVAPFITWTKPQIIKYAKDENLPLEITYSCERGTSPPCGKCLSCLDRENI